MRYSVGGKKEGYLDPRHLTQSKMVNHTLLPSGYDFQLQAMGGQVRILFHRSTRLGLHLFS